MSHSLSLDVMEMAEVAALLERLAAGLEAAPPASPPLSSSACRDRTEPCVRTCCCSLQGTGTHSITARLSAPRGPAGSPPLLLPRDSRDWHPLLQLTPVSLVANWPSQVALGTTPGPAPLLRRHTGVGGCSPALRILSPKRDWSEASVTPRSISRAVVPSSRPYICP